MKKIILTLGIILLGAGLSFAETPTEKAAENTAVMGTISAVTPADTAKGMKASIDLIEEGGKEAKIELPSSVKIWDAASKTISWTDIKANSKAKVEYKMVNGAMEATTIHLE